VKAKTIALLALAVLLVICSAVSAGCGSNGTGAVDKAKLTAALSAFELSAGAMTQALAAGSDETVATAVKAAKTDMKSKWQDVMAAAKSLDWPGRSAADEAWANVEHTIDSLAGNATVATANAALTPAMDGLMAAETELWNLAQPSE
jgi:hypothetical protein